MSNIVGGNITTLGTEKVERGDDDIIALMERRVEKAGYKIVSIANGLGAPLTHSKSKG